MGTQPDYLKHLEVRRRADRSDHTCTVVLLPAARALVPEHFQQQIADVAPDHEIYLGLVTRCPRPGTGAGRVTQVAAWTFSCPDRIDGGPPGSYLSRHDAAESCAVEIIDGPSFRLRFDVERWQRRRPNDN